MKRKNWSRFVASCGLSLLVATILLQPLVQAAVVWSDDFDDGNYDGWTVHDGTFTAENNILESTTIEWPDWPDDPDYYNSISHPSEIVTGTWSFDFNLSSYEYFMTPSHFEIVFMANTSDWKNVYGYGFAVIIWQNVWSFELIKFEGSGPHHNRIYSFVFSSKTNCKLDWTNVKISRNASGYFTAYINDTLRLKGSDTDFDTSTHLIFYAHQQSAIDNITVNDEPIPLTPTPTPTPTPTDTTTETTTTDTSPPPVIQPELLAIGIGVPVILVIVLVVWKVRK